MAERVTNELRRALGSLHDRKACDVLAAPMTDIDQKYAEIQDERDRLREALQDVVRSCSSAPVGHFGLFCGRTLQLSDGQIQRWKDALSKKSYDHEPVKPAEPGDGSVLDIQRDNADKVANLMEQQRRGTEYAPAAKACAFPACDCTSAVCPRDGSVRTGQDGGA